MRKALSTVIPWKSIGNNPIQQNSDQMFFKWRFPINSRPIKQYCNLYALASWIDVWSKLATVFTRHARLAVHKKNLGFQSTIIVNLNLPLKHRGTANGIMPTIQCCKTSTASTGFFSANTRCLWYCEAELTLCHRKQESCVKADSLKDWKCQTLQH